VDGKPLRRTASEKAETIRFSDRCRWDSAFWRSEPHSLIPSTWPILEEALRKFAGSRRRKCFFGVLEN